MPFRNLQIHLNKLAQQVKLKILYLFYQNSIHYTIPDFLHFSSSKANFTTPFTTPFFQKMTIFDAPRQKVRTRKNLVK